MSKRTADDSERRELQRTLDARGQDPEVKSINGCVLPRTRDTGDYDSVATGESALRIYSAHTGSRRRPSYTSYRVTKRSSDRSLAQRPLPQVPQWHHRVAKRASIGTLARRPSTEALLGQGRVPKERKSVPLQGLWSGSRPGLARHPRLQVALRQGLVAKGASIGTLARRPYPQMPQWHPRGATVSWCIG